MTEFDVDAEVEKTLLPWELYIKTKGKRFATRCPTIGELGAIAELEGRKDKQAEAMVIQLVSQLFDDPKAATAAMSLPAFMLASKRILTYAQEYIRKNFPAAASKDPSAAAKVKDSGSGSL